MPLPQITPANLRRMHQDAVDEECRTSFRRYCQEALHEIPASIQVTTHVRWNDRLREFCWYLDAAADHLSAWCTGEIQFLLFNIKNKALKSTLGTVLLPTWDWIDHPTRQWLTGSHQQDLAIRDCRLSRAAMDTDWYRRIRRADEIGAWRMVTDQNTKGHYVNDRGGHRYGAWPPSGTGRGGSRFIVDDPLGIHERTSNLKNEEANRWVLETVMSRMNDAATDGLCVIQHRLRKDDTSAVLRDRFGDRVEVLSLPLEYNPRKTMPATSLGWIDPRSTDAPDEKLPVVLPDDERGEGASLDPRRWTDKVIDQEKKSQGALYPALSNQDPADLGDNVVQPEWLPRFTNLPPDAELRMVTSCDPGWKGQDPTKKAVKRSKTCLIAAAVVGSSGKAARCYVVDYVCRHMDPIERELEFKAFHERHPDALTKHVEDEAGGVDIIRRLAMVVPGINPVVPKGDKYARFVAVSPFFLAHNVWLPPDGAAPWVKDFVRQLTEYPNVEFDDDIDTISQLLSQEMMPAELNEGPSSDEIFDQWGAIVSG